MKRFEILNIWTSSLSNSNTKWDINKLILIYNICSIRAKKWGITLQDWESKLIN